MPHLSVRELLILVKFGGVSAGATNLLKPL